MSGGESRLWSRLSATRVASLLSLALQRGWTEPRLLTGVQLTAQGAQHTVFEGREQPFRPGWGVSDSTEVQEHIRTYTHTLFHPVLAFSTHRHAHQQRAQVLHTGRSPPLPPFASSTLLLSSPPATPHASHMPGTLLSQGFHTSCVTHTHTYRDLHSSPSHGSGPCSSCHPAGMVTCLARCSGVQPGKRNCEPGPQAFPRTAQPGTEMAMRCKALIEA